MVNRDYVSWTQATRVQNKFGSRMFPQEWESFPDAGMALQAYLHTMRW